MCKMVAEVEQAVDGELSGGVDDEEQNTMRGRGYI